QAAQSTLGGVGQERDLTRINEIREQDCARFRFPAALPRYLSGSVDSRAIDVHRGMGLGYADDRPQGQDEDDPVEGTSTLGVLMVDVDRVVGIILGYDQVLRLKGSPNSLFYL